jgi:hypothetical protein
MGVVSTGHLSMLTLVNSTRVDTVLSAVMKALIRGSDPASVSDPKVAA